MEIIKVFIFIVLLSIYVHIAESCTCIRRHPQLKYQTEDVLIIEIQKILPGTPTHSEYSAIIREVLKKNTNAQVGQGIILSSLKSCGYNFFENLKYVLSGKYSDGKLELSICGINFYITQFTAERREIFETFETVGDACEVPISTSNSEPNNKQCQIDSNSKVAECQYRFGACIPESQRCVWRQSPAYQRCV